jgi:hypothetical protein
MDKTIVWLAGFFTDYQVWATFISAAVGFGGVIATLVLQHKSSVVLLAEDGRRAKCRLLGALRAELEQIKKDSEDVATDLESPSYSAGHDGVKFPKKFMYTLGDALAPKFDLLEPVQVAATLRCYAYSRDIPTRIALFGVPGGDDPSFVYVPTARVKYVASLYRNLAEHAGRAVAALSDAE